MERIVVDEQKVGLGGVLELHLPLGEDRAGQDVRVTIEAVGPKPPMTPEEWRAGILASAGTWQGEFEGIRPAEVGSTEGERLPPR